MSQALDRSVAVLQSVGIHVLFAAVMIFGLSVSRSPSVPRIPLTIQATVVDRQAIIDARERQAEEDRQRLRDEAAERRRRQEAERQQELQQQREERERQQRQEQRQSEQRAHQQAADAERQRMADLERRRQEIQRQKEAAAEATRKEEERLAQLADIKRQEDAARQQALDAERRKQLMAVEQANAEAATLEQEWIALVQSIVTANWQRPPTARDGLNCRVQVHQAPGGRVLDVAILPGCNGDEATRRSIVNAVWRSDPLPYRGYEPVLKRSFQFEFVY